MRDRKEIKSKYTFTVETDHNLIKALEQVIQKAVSDAIRALPVPPAALPQGPAWPETRLPNRKTKQPNSKTKHKTQRKNRGIQPPPTFDIDRLVGNAHLTALETAAVLRRTPSALEQWRRDPNHPLKVTRVDGRPLYRVDNLRAYLKIDLNKKKPSKKRSNRKRVRTRALHLA